VAIAKEKQSEKKLLGVNKKKKKKKVMTFGEKPKFPSYF